MKIKTDELDRGRWGGVYHVLLIVNFANGDREIEGEVHLLPENIAESHEKWRSVMGDVEKIQHSVDNQEDIAPDYDKIKTKRNSVQTSTTLGSQVRDRRFRIRGHGAGR